MRNSKPTILRLLESIFEDDRFGAYGSGIEITNPISSRTCPTQ
jgi:hypothetical protein